MQQVQEIEIDVTKSAMENMHILLMSTAVEEIPIEEYRLDPPQPYIEPGNNYHNTSVMIHSLVKKRTGSDTHYYHRVNVGNKGFETEKFPGHRIIARPFKIDSDEVERLKQLHQLETKEEAAIYYISNEIGLVPTEFTLPVFETTDEKLSGYITHLLTAKEDSYLYIRDLGVKIEFIDKGTLDDELPGFDEKPEEGN